LGDISESACSVKRGVLDWSLGGTCTLASWPAPKQEFGLAELLVDIRYDARVNPGGAPSGSPLTNDALSEMSPGFRGTIRILEELREDVKLASHPRVVLLRKSTLRREMCPERLRKH
jgi:hypothetical protein